MAAMSSFPESFDLRGKRVYVAGHSGMAGSAIVRRLQSEDCEILVAEFTDVEDAPGIFDTLEVQFTLRRHAA